MTEDEIRRYTALGRNNSVCVDIRAIPEFPGLIRDVTIFDENRVKVEFFSWGNEDREGGPYFWATYKSLEAIIASLELYLEKPLAEWTNYNRTGEYPPQPSAGSWTHEEFRNAVIKRLLPLPVGADFVVKPQYWDGLEIFWFGDSEENKEND